MRAATSDGPTTGRQPRVRALGLIRVSKEGGRGERLLSPEIQRASIEEYCARRDYDITDYVVAIDESGSRQTSSWWARLDQAIEHVEAGAVDVIVAWEFSRPARNRLRWAVALDRVESAGGSIESATEPVDATTASGRFQRGVLAEMHAYKAEAIGEAWKDVHRNRIARGLPSTGGARFGYVQAGKSGPYEPDPHAGPILAEMYQRAIRGESMMSIAEWLNREGIPTLPGGPWSRSRIRPILDSGFGAGLLTVRVRDSNGAVVAQQYHPGIHPPVIDDATWQAYRRQRELAPYLPTQNAARYPLTGLLVCGDCGAGMSMTNRTSAGRRQQLYGCNRYQKYRSGRYVTTVRDRVEEWVKSEVAAMVADLEGRVAARVKMRARKVASANDAAVIARKVAKIDARIAKAMDGWASGLLTDDEYKAGVARYRDEREGLLARQAVVHQDGLADDRVGAVASALVAGWDGLEMSELRAMLSALVGAVIVRPPAPGERGATYAVLWRWELRDSAPPVQG